MEKRNESSVKKRRRELIGELLKENPLKGMSAKRKKNRSVLNITIKKI